MDISYLKKLIKLVSESQIDELEIEEEGSKIKIAKGQNNSFGHGAIPPPAQASLPHMVPYAQSSPALNTPPSISEQTPPSESATTSPPGKKFYEIKSPIVGTFYRAPAPDAAPFIEIGSTIETGTVLCIVEAMKLMNEIESDVGGKIAKILVENGQPVEYDQTLFLVDQS